MGLARRHGLRDRRRRARDVLAGLSFRDRDLRVRDEALSFGLLAYLLSFLVLPALHLSNHALDHDHGDGAAVATAHHGEGARHGHDHSDDARHGHHDDDRQRAPLPAPSHGHGTTAHFAVAFSAVTTFVFLPALRPFVASPCLPPSPGPELGIPDGCAKPRGPPGVG